MPPVLLVAVQKIVEHVDHRVVHRVTADRGRPKVVRDDVHHVEVLVVRLGRLELREGVESVEPLAEVPSALHHVLERGVPPGAT